MIFLLFIVALCTAFYFYRREKMKFFLKLGIKGPNPNFLLGNLLEIRKVKYPDLLQKWQNEFGNLFGYFEGSTPVLVMSDPDLLQEVLVKQFSNFHGRKLFPLQMNPDEDPKINMFFARGKRWKRLRTTINPAFSEGKMRKMYSMIDDCIGELMLYLHEKVASGDKEMNIQEPLQRMTMDIICKCAFGVETNCQKNINHPFIVILKKFLSGQSSSTLQAMFVLMFPEIREWILKFFKAINRQPGDNPNFLAIKAKMVEVIEARKKSTEKKTDLLQMLLDAEVPGLTLLDEDNLCPMNNISSLVKEDDSLGHDPSEEAGDDVPARSTGIRGGKPMTTEEVVNQANLFLFAGYGTSSTAMTFLMHALIEFPEVQKKLQAEIDATFKDKDYENLCALEFYDIIVKMTYLNAVIFEILRYYPFVTTVVNRLCMKSEGTYLSNGVYISKGVNIVPNAFSLHFDENLWPGIDPKLFAPERFLHIDGDSVEFVGPPHPLAWIPFGAGPRNCIGQRFAMMVMKSTVVRFFKKFKVSATSKTEFPIELNIGPSIRLKNGVHLLLQERTSIDSNS